ncbi:MAG: helix-turn-helix transcriptional regulator [Ruminococcaceae bacterium]|nr:helix-turn-helix transcriptional regulator [Oscillospiraceae bacterium]
MKNSLSERLKFYRKSLGLTQEQVASAIGVNRSTYTYYEKGSSSPNLASLMQLSSLFGVEYSDLIGENDNVLRVAQSDPFESVEDMIPFNTLTKMEKDLLCRFRVLSDAQKIEMLKNMGIEKYQTEDVDE